MPIVHADPCPRLIEDEQVQLVLLELVQHGALVGDIAGQALAEAGVLPALIWSFSVS